MSRRVLIAVLGLILIPQSVFAGVAVTEDGRGKTVAPKGETSPPRARAGQRTGVA